MFKIKKASLVLGIKVAILIFFSVTLVVSGYVYSTISELKLKLKQTQLSKASLESSQSTLERETQIKYHHLGEFLLFTDNNELEQELLEKNSIEKKRANYFIKEQIILPKLYDNHCQKYKCIQIKKNFLEIPASIWKALLGTEDFRFLEHKGIDYFAIARAVIVDLMAMKFVQGGSTLTQQLMKNLFLTNERSISRKIKEMIYAIYIENIMEKEEIITLYLNEVFWGTFQGIYIKGFQAASLAYFNKPAEKLTEFESTILVSLLKGPNYYRPSRFIERLKQRSSAVHKRLMQLNLVSKDSTKIWSDLEWENFQKSYIKRENKNYFFYYYLVSKNVEQGIEPYEKFVFYSAVYKRKRELKSITKDADVAVKSIIADKSCESYECKKVFSFYSKLEREKRSAITGERHQVGSLFKPIVYDTFIDFGRSYEEKISTKAITLNLKSGPWSPKDYSQAKKNEILLKHALQKSKNIPLIRIASEIGFEKLEPVLKERIERLKTPLGEYPAQLLGAIELSMEEVFKIYLKFIQDKCGEIKEKKIPLEETILYYMSVAGETTISRLAKPPLKYAYIFGKTGTTNNGLDNWYFAFDGSQIYAIWFGVESKRDEYNLRISGATTSFLIFQDFINHRGKQTAEIHCGG